MVWGLGFGKACVASAPSEAVRKLGRFFTVTHEVAEFRKKNP